ncbi:Mut7-C RNAse domain-containing protein [Halorussus aquaticus]|uniref:Mut7-C RNAse domain-containing protein n=1 Tax=Halorussus aquaticus TaxID=2953748 RepID=A0ABD5Q0E8_9EURY|nr:Mut7-C RNAse domain-containing protein [Halorussus aquaticus]
MPTRTPAESALLLDAMLGKLATYLRMCGYDAAYALDREARSASERTSGEERCDDPGGVEADDDLLALAESEGRLLVTRDAELAERADGLLLTTKPVTDQLRELSDAGFELELSDPTRCAECNAELVAVTPGAQTPEYAPDTDEFRVWRCPECDQYFWMGSHWASVEETLSDR